MSSSYQAVHLAGPPQEYAVATDGLHKAAFFALLVMAATVPLVTLETSRFATSIPWWQRVTISDFTGGAAVLLAMVGAQTRNPSRLLLYAAPFLIWCAFGTLQAMAYPAQPGIMPAFQAYHLAIFVYVFFLAHFGISLIVDARALKLLLAAFMVGVAFQSIVILHDTLAIFGFTSMWFPDAMAGRLRGTFRASGQLGQFTMGGVFLGFAFAAWPGLKRKWVAVVLLLVGISALGAFFASRRSAVLCIGVWFMLLLLRSILSRQGRQTIWPLVVLLGLSAVGVMYALTSDYADFAEKRFGNLSGFFAEGGFLHRQWMDTLNIVREHPIFGCGLGQAMYYTTDGHELHNGFLTLLAETGLVGVFLLFAFPLAAIAGALYRLWQVAKDTPYQELAIRLIIPFVAWAIFSIHNRIWRDRGFWIAVIVVYGLCYVAQQYRQFYQQWHQQQMLMAQQADADPTPDKG